MTGTGARQTDKGLQGGREPRDNQVGAAHADLVGIVFFLSICCLLMIKMVQELCCTELGSMLGHLRPQNSCHTRQPAYGYGFGEGARLLTPAVPLPDTSGRTRAGIETRANHYGPLAA